MMRPGGVRRSDAGSDLGARSGIGAVDAPLLAISIVVFIYLGIAMFKPEWF
jgi:hypothetical protein